MTTRLCVPITEGRAEDVIARMRELPPEVSTVEIRFDMLVNPDVEAICRGRDREIIATCRLASQGGHFKGDEGQRLNVLRRAVSSGAEFVDLEFARRDAAGSLHLPGTCRLILSEHDFDRTPDDLAGLYRRIADARPHVVKIATRAVTIMDSVRMLELMRRAAEPFIGICMGEEGVVTRLLAPKLGGWLTFASLAQGAESAPGQLSYREMIDLYRLPAMGPATRVYGVIANPVGHSMSPAIHNAAFRRVGLDAVYLPLKVEDVAAFVPSFRQFDVGGYSVTIPHKEAMLSLVDEVEPLVERIGALNTVVYSGGRALGYNTDVKAAVGAIRRACVRAGWGQESSVLGGRTVLLIGAGGAGRALGYGLREAGAEVVIANRTASRAERLAREIGARGVGLDALRADTDYDVLVNTTSVGMYPKIDESPVPAELLRAGKVVFDAVYNPLQTLLLRLAQEAGCVTASGFEWFVGQAAAQFELWTKLPAPVDVMAEVVRRRLSR